jgi:hypothetical protein
MTFTAVCAQSSKQGEFHLLLLTETYVNLSIHKALRFAVVGVRADWLSDGAITNNQPGICIILSAITNPQFLFINLTLPAGEVPLTTVQY